MMEMSPVSLMIVFACGVFFALSDFTRKKASQFCAPEVLVALIFTAIAPIYWLFFFISEDKSWSVAYILPGAAGIFANLLANIFFIRSVSISPLSKTIPLLSLTPILTALIGAGFLGETLALQQWAGIALVVVGIFILYAPRDQGFHPVTVWKNFTAEKGAKYMCYVALFWTLAPSFDRIALRHTTVPIAGMIHFTTAALILWTWLYACGKLSKTALPTRAGYKTIGLLALFYAAAMGTQMLALKMVFVGIVESVKRVIAQLSALILGRIAFQEPVTPEKTGAILLMILGVPMIVLPGLFAF